MTVLRRWVTKAPTTLAQVLASMGERSEVVEQGRVFVGKRRARSMDEPVAAREEVQVHPPRAIPPLPEPFVLHDDQGIVAVDKPAGIPTIPDLEGAQGSLIDLSARHTRRTIDRLHPTSRLDREVSGVVLFADGPEAKDALADARAQGRYVRRYVALCAGAFEGDRARWTWPIERAGRKPLQAESRARVVARSQEYLLLALAPVTGRTHQLRIHAARAQVPILGDGLYGGSRRLTSARGAVRTLDRIALHCAHVQIGLRNGCIISVGSPVPPELRELARLTGLVSQEDGHDPFEEALGCEI